MAVPGNRCLILLTGFGLMLIISQVYWSEIIQYVNNYYKLNVATVVWKAVISTGIVPNNTTIAESTTYNTTRKTTTRRPLHNLKNQTSTVQTVPKRTLYITSTHFTWGRLGNQMFKYASLLGMARAQDRNFFIASGSSLEATFKLQYVNSSINPKNWTSIIESNPVSVDPKLLKLPFQNVKIKGFLQSFYYFADIMDEVRQEFTFQDKVANDAAAILHDVLNKNRASLVVGVHVRRGDFLKHIKLGYGVPEKSYFMKAFSCMKSTFPNRKVIFLVASDDMVWCNTNIIGNDVVAMPNASAAVHMAVLSRCEHVIISGGTFGWWGAILAGGKVIYYTGYMKPGTILGNRLAPKLYYPRLWIGMEN